MSKHEYIITPLENQTIRRAMDAVYTAIDDCLWKAILAVEDPETNAKLRKLFADNRCEGGLKLLYAIRDAATESEDRLA